uniref:Peptidase S39 domain-containing protein n=1 Tax=Solemoviridae sp. TaxID=2715208 RepID=A0A6M3YPK5_9VIRU|nr:MAG: hypothetical protein 1 [Solemoviridae sp.]
MCCGVLGDGTMTWHPDYFPKEVVILNENACERRLEVCHDKLIEKDETIKKLDYDLLLSRHEVDKLTEIKSMLDKQVSELQEKLSNEQANSYMLTIYSVCAFGICLVQLLWWAGPLVWLSTRETIRALGSFLWYICMIPSRIVADFRARAGVTREEQIPLSELRREAMLPQSPLVGVETYDKCIFKIFQVDRDYSDLLHYVGLGFWCGMAESAAGGLGMFLTAQHCLPAEGEIVLQNANNDRKSVRVPVANWSTLEEYDVAYLVPEQSTTTKLGISKAKAPNQRLKQCAVVTVYGRDKSSMGPLKAFEDSINLKYVGSTTPGFSGSPYMSGRTVYGMHLGSTQDMGMGIDVGFLNMKLTRKLVMRKESTEEWLLDEIEKAEQAGRKINWTRYGLDDVVIEINGRDIMYDLGSWFEIYEHAHETEIEHKTYYGKKRGKANDDDEIVQRKKGKGKGGRFEYEAYVDIPELPKNVMSPTPVLVSGDTHATAAPKPLNPKLSKLLNSPLGEKIMIGQPSIAVASSEVSEDTYKSMKTQLDRLLSRLMVIEKELDIQSARKSKTKSASKSTQRTT